MEQGSWTIQDKTGKNVFIEWHKVTDYKTFFELQRMLIPIQAAAFGQQMKDSLLDEKRRIRPEYLQQALALPELMRVIKCYQDNNEKLFLDEQIINLDRACTKCIAEQIIFPKTCFFVIAKDEFGSVLGYTIFHCKSKYSQNTVRLEPLAVTPIAQGRGLGRVLIFSVLQILPETSRIFLKTSFWFTGAISIYKKLGFKEKIDGPWHNFEYNIEK